LLQASSGAAQTTRPVPAIPLPTFIPLVAPSVQGLTGDNSLFGDVKFVATTILGKPLSLPGFDVSNSYDRAIRAAADAAKAAKLKTKAKATAEAAAASAAASPSLT
jgi:hypothetical protein